MQIGAPNFAKNLNSEVGEEKKFSWDAGGLFIGDSIK